MSEETRKHVSEEEALELAEASRQKEWRSPSFLKELFLGNFRLDLVYPFPRQGTERPEFVAFCDAFRAFLQERVDPRQMDAEGEYPEEVVEGLRKLGAFGMKIPSEYGGLGFTQTEYQKVMRLLGSFDGNLSALLSAHQSIGVPQPVKLFGSDELKKRYLPRCARGEISAFALTEPDVGSDPARLSTTATLTPEGDAYLLNGTKLWCTNGTLAKLLVVMARNPATHEISAFVVETEWKGVKIDHRCRFMGLKALSNAQISFHDVRIPRENLIGEEGKGLKIALTTLNDGRLSIPNGLVGTAQSMLAICREWSASRVQWGRPVGKHEAIAHKLADVVADTWAMDSIAELTTAMADRGNYDIRLEAAAAKLWNSEKGWEIVDHTMQIRGGRGYETELSLLGRGEDPIPVERVMRDSRINRIFEGSSEIMHLFMAREAVDKHLEVAGALIDPKISVVEKLLALPDIALFYSTWYPTRWIPRGGWRGYGEFGGLARHLRFAERSSRKLSREVFHGMMVHQGRLQYKQAFLFRLVDVADELFAMTASVLRAQAFTEAGDSYAREARELADLFCRKSRREVGRLFRDLWLNDDALRYRAGKSVVEGRYRFLEEGIMPIPRALPAGDPATVAEPERPVTA